MKIVDEYFKEHKLFSETYKIAAKEILVRFHKEILDIIDSENSGLSHQQRLNEIKKLLK